MGLTSALKNRGRLKTAKARSERGEGKLLDQTYLSDNDAQSETKSTLDIYNNRYFKNKVANQTLSVKEITRTRYSEF